MTETSPNGAEPQGQAPAGLPVTDPQPPYPVPLPRPLAERPWNRLPVRYQGIVLAALAAQEGPSETPETAP